MAKKATKRVKKQVRSVASILNSLDRVLVKGDRRAKDLWNILTALRGPDFGDGKTQVTIPIRRRAFPLVAAKSDSGKFINIGASFSRTYGSFLSSHLPYGHFCTHGEKAWASLQRVRPVSAKKR